jgi:NAD(P) transhydrogenase subunit beta
MSANLTAVLYLISAVLFIMALRGLSSPETSRQGNTYGMVGMAIAVLTTLFATGLTAGSFFLIVIGVGVGGGLGAYIAQRIPMTAMPQLVAAFHSLVGLAAVFVAASALYAPGAFGIGAPGQIYTSAMVEMPPSAPPLVRSPSPGRLSPFAKLDGRMSGKPIMLPMRHAINSALASLMVVLTSSGRLAKAMTVFWPS